MYQRENAGQAVWRQSQRSKDGFGPLQRRDGGYIGQRMLNMKLSGRKKRERLQRRFMDVVKVDIGGCEGLDEMEAGHLL